MHRRLQNVYFEVREPRTAWDDIGGHEAAKAALREMVCVPIARRAELARMGVEPPRGVMLWGPLGNGITMLAEACAREAGVTFFWVSGREMLGKPGDVEEAFRLAMDEAPCVLFVADTDWLAPRAGADYTWPGDGDRGKPPTFADPGLTRTFVEMLDLVGTRPEVALLGSCYRIDVVDQAILRDKDRFNRKVFVPPPMAADRLAMLRIFSRRFHMEPGLDLERWARETEGCVGWDVENLCKKAGLAAVAAGRDRIADADMAAAAAQVRRWLNPEMTRGYLSLFEGDCPHHYTF